MPNKDQNSPTNRIKFVIKNKSNRGKYNIKQSSKQYMQDNNNNKAKGSQTKNWHRHNKANSDKQTQRSDF